MKLWRTPYRWIPRCYWANIRSIWIDLTYGPYNIFRWIPVIWFDSDWDWCFLAQIMEYKLRRMAKSSANGHLLNGERYARQMRICADILHRMDNDQFYYDNAEKRYPNRDSIWAKSISKHQKADQEYLGLMIGKYMRHWWD